MPEPEREYTVAKFYESIMQDHSKEVQQLLISVLRKEFAQANELAKAITDVAERSDGAGEGSQ